MGAGSLRNIAEPKFRTPEVVKIGNNPPPTTPPGAFVAPVPPDTTWVDLENREYSEFQISVDADFHVNTIHANEGARFRFFIFRATETEITVDINPWQDEQIKIPGTLVSKIFVLNVECYLIPGEDKLRYKVTNLIFDHQARKDKTWSSSKIKETIDAVINDEIVSLTGTWSSDKLSKNLEAKQDSIGDSLQVDEIIRKSDDETGGLNLISRATFKDGVMDAEDEFPGFKFYSRVYDGSGNLIIERIPLYSDSRGYLEALRLNASHLTLNNLGVATENFVNEAILALSGLMSTDAERLAAINELAQNYNEADEQLQQTLTTALATKAGKAVAEIITGLWNFSNGLFINGFDIYSLFLGKSEVAVDAYKLGGSLASEYLRRGVAETITGYWIFDNTSGETRFDSVNVSKNRLLINAQIASASSQISFAHLGVTKWSVGNHFFADSLIISQSSDLGSSITATLTKAGWLKLGDTNPTAKLDVDGDIKGFKGLFATSIAVASGITLRTAATTGVVENNAGGDLVVYGGSYTAGEKALHLGYNCTLYTTIGTKVKVNATTEPTEALDVDGNIKALRGMFGGSENTETNELYVRGLDTVDIAWVGKLKNFYNASVTGYGAGLKLSLGGATENNKWAGLAAVGESGYANDVGLVVYTSLATAHAERLRVTAAGNVGIGVVAPTEKLQIKGKILVNNSDIPDQGVLIENNGATSGNASGRIFFKENNVNTCGIDLQYDGVNNRFEINRYDNSATPINVLYVGRSSNAVYFMGDVHIAGATYNDSDRRLKSNIQPLTPRGELNPVTFIKDGKPDIGFIAQEVKEVYPELVGGEETEDTYLSLNYAQLTAVLYAELKELRAEVKSLKEQIQNDPKI